MRDLVALLRREQPCQRVEIVLLEKIEQHLAVGEVLNDDALVLMAGFDGSGDHRRRDDRRSYESGAAAPTTPTP